MNVARPVADTADWLVIEESFEPTRLRSAEAVFTIGNGRFATRGSFEEGYPGDQPATLAHGVWAPHAFAVSELAGLPDWTGLDILVGGHRVSLATGELLRYWRVLDMRTGLLRRNVTWRSPTGETLELGFERFVSLADDHLAGVRLTVTTLDGDGSVEVHAGLDAHAATDGAAHLAWTAQAAAGATVALGVDITGSAHRVGLATSIRTRGTSISHEALDVRGHPVIATRWTARPGLTVVLDKIVALETSREVADPMPAAVARLDAVGDRTFDELLAESAAAWRREWDRSDVVIEGDAEAQLAIRFAIYHLLIAAPRSDEQVSIGARTLSGFGYRGHAFWDTETFMLPFFTHARPDIARNLLSYRYHRLAGARRKAASGGYDGAQFPWESAETGDEVTPALLPHADSPSRMVRIWTGDLEIHLSAVIAHAVTRYWEATGDDAFMLERGAEMIVETGRFWASRAEWNAAAGHYELTDVIGPDEYHDRVDNNAFTNYVAAWHLRTAADVGEWLIATDPAKALALLGPEAAAFATLERFRSVAAAMYLPRDPVTGMIEQFSGYFGRRDVDLAAHAGRQASMQTILGIEGVAETQVIKQPDVLMLAYLLPEAFDEQALAANHAYYSPRTDHEYGSSLGPAIQALLAARMGDTDDAYAHFERAARTDLADVRGNGADGIHAAAAGGLWQAVVFGFAGLRFVGDEVTTDPRLPAHWTRLAFTVVHRGRPVAIDLRRPVEPAVEPGGVRGLIFDLDGVLATTADAHYRAWQRLADEEGIPFDLAANEALRGVDRRESLRRLLGARSVTAAEAEELMGRKNAYFRDLIAALTPADLLPGARELVSGARARGLSVALASGSRNAVEVVGRLGIADLFDALCDGSSVQRGKPAPDLFLTAAAALGLPPESCVVFEDAADGIEAAHAAGMMAVGIGPVDRVGAAELVLEGGFEGADLEGILAALAGPGEVAA